MEARDIRRGRRGNCVGLVVTLALHGAVLGAVAVAHGEEPAGRAARHEFVRAELVMLGTAPTDQLPDIDAPLPPPAESARDIEVTRNPDAPSTRVEPPVHVSEPRRSVGDRSRRVVEALDVDHRVVGAANGSAWGTSNREVGDRYLGTVQGALARHYDLPAGMTPDQIPSPPEIEFRFADDGLISDVKLTKSSGNPLVDEACVGAATLARRLPPPPAGYGPRGLRVACEK